MSSTVTFHLLGPHSGPPFTFTEPGVVVIGRDAACGLRLDDVRNPPEVSRRHCELVLDPPAVRVRDLDSVNGTSINGRLIGNRAQPSTNALMLFDGDTLGVADYRLRVTTTPVLCSGCSQPIVGERSRSSDGSPLCGACRESPPTVAPSNEHFDALQRLLAPNRTGVRAPSPLHGYEVVCELGRGGMGVVYLARHMATRARVALKVMLPHLASNEQIRARFLREIGIVRALTHPHIVTALDSGCEGSAYYLEMEYCEGGSVDQFLTQRGQPLAPHEAVPLILQVLDALHYAHQAEIPSALRADGDPARGVVHRDLKPANLLLADATGKTVKIADFGLAKAFELAGLSGYTRSHQILGTPHFCPKQQLVNSLMAGPEVDVWAAAACLYYLLTGSTVRDYPAGADPLIVVSTRPAVPIRQRRANIPEKLANLIDHALKEEPNLAFATADEFRTALAAT